jgi:hypothetical protein
MEFYRDWMFGEGDEFILGSFKGPALTPLTQRSPVADKWLSLFAETIEMDKAYHDRLIRHYWIAKNQL